MSSSLIFEILALDTQEKSNIKAEENIIYAFLANGFLWSDEKYDDIPQCKIIDGETTLEVKRVKEDVNADIELSRAFLVTVKSNYDWLEPNRESFLKLLKGQQFDFLYILSDGVSEKIANDLYPLIYEVENSLRSYLVKFMTTRIGPEWWDSTARKDRGNRSESNNNNPKAFSGFIDNKVYSIDFSYLGSLIYDHSSGYTDKDDLRKKVLKLDANSETLKNDIQKLKKDLESNYQKFFNTSFKKKGFQQKWQNLKDIRNKVAHNNLFTSDDLLQGKKLSDELLEIIKAASRNVDEVTLDFEEKEAIAESIASQGELNFISEDELLKELKEREEYYSSRPNGFVSFSNFVRVHLASKGYDPSSAYQLIEDLKMEKKIEFYYVDNPYSDNPTRAIKVAEGRET